MDPSDNIENMKNKQIRNIRNPSAGKIRLLCFLTFFKFKENLKFSGLIKEFLSSIVYMRTLFVQSPLLTSVYVLGCGAGTNQFYHGPTVEVHTHYIVYRGIYD